MFFGFRTMITKVWGRIVSVGVLTLFAGGIIALAVRDVGNVRGSDTGPGYDQRIAEGQYASGRIWLRTESGSLVSYAPDFTGRREHFDSGVAALRKANGVLWLVRVLSRGPGENHTFVVTRWSGSKFADQAAGKLVNDEAPLSLLFSGARPIVLTSGSLYRFEDGRFLRTALNGKLRTGVQFFASVTGNGQHLYTGSNAGEWGGGVQRIDLETGQVLNVEQRDQGCDGPLNSDCNPVTGMAADMANPECVIVAIGLVHLGTDGRVVRLCTEQVQVLIERKHQVQGWNRTFDESEAFYGVEPTPWGFWTTTHGTLFRFRDGEINEYTRLRYLHKGELVRTRPYREFVVLSTAITASVAVGWYTPLVISLE